MNLEEVIKKFNKRIDKLQQFVHKADLQFMCDQFFERNKTHDGQKFKVKCCEMTKKECPWVNRFQTDGRNRIFRIENCEYAIEFWVDKHRRD